MINPGNIMSRTLRLAIADARTGESVCHGRFFVLLVLDVLWKDQDRGAVGRLCHPDASVDEMPYLGRRGGFVCEDCHVREHAVEVELLLVAGAPNGGLSLSANRQNRRVVQFSVVQARDQVSSAGTAGR
jgi:hypothetical protein